MLMFLDQQLTYSQICSRNSSTMYQGYSSVFQMGGSSPKIGAKFLKAGWNVCYKQRMYCRENALLSQLRDTTSPLDFQCFYEFQSVLYFIQVLYFISQCHYYAEYFFDIEHLTYAYYISSKTSANKASFFKRD